MARDISQREFVGTDCPKTRRELFWYLARQNLDRFTVVKEGPMYSIIVQANGKVYMCGTGARSIDHWSFEGWAKLCLDKEWEVTPQRRNAA